MTKVLTYLLLIFIAVTTPIEFGRLQAVQAHQNDALHSIICFAEQYVENSKKTPPAQKQAVVKFYDRALRDAHLPPCNNGG